MQSPSLFHLGKETENLLKMIFPTSKRMEDEESLEAVGLVRQSSYAVHSHLAAQVHCKICGKDHSKFY